MRHEMWKWKLEINFISRILEFKKFESNGKKICPIDFSIDF